MNPEELRERTRAHLLAFIGVLVLAMMAAATVYAEETRSTAVFVIAAVQVLIVLSKLMHAFKEGPWIRWLLASCALFVAALAGMVYLGFNDTIQGTEHVVLTTPTHDAGGETETEHESTEPAN